MKYEMNAPEIRILGRTVPGRAVPVFWTGSGIETVFEGVDLYLEYVSQYDVYEDWIRVEMDGATLIRMPLEAGHHTICLLRHIRPDVRKPLRILKEVQPMKDDPDRMLVFCSLTTHGHLYAPAEHPLKIEFVGDSLTAGQGLCGPVGYTDWTSLSFSTENHYAMTVARELDAEVSMVAQGGWGVATAWNNDVEDIIPRIYNQVCSVAEGETVRTYGGLNAYASEQWQADVVVVNLGTNDANAFHQPPWTDSHGRKHQMTLNPDGSHSEEGQERIIGAVKDFLKQIRRMHPKAYLMWVYGMCGNEIGELLLRGVDRYRAETGDEKAEYYPLSAAQADEMGSNDHPGAPCHIRTGKAIAAEITGWLHLNDKNP